MDPKKPNLIDVNALPQFQQPVNLIPQAFDMRGAMADASNAFGAGQYGRAAGAGLRAAGASIGNALSFITTPPVLSQQTVDNVKGSGFYQGLAGDVQPVAQVAPVAAPAPALAALPKFDAAGTLLPKAYTMPGQEPLAVAAPAATKAAASPVAQVAAGRQINPNLSLAALIELAKIQPKQQNVSEKVGADLYSYYTQMYAAAKTQQDKAAAMAGLQGLRAPTLVPNLSLYGQQSAE